MLHITPIIYDSFVSFVFAILFLFLLDTSLSGFAKAHDRRTRNSYTRNLHEIEHALFDARNSREKYLAASRYDTRTNFSRELTRMSFSYEFLVRVSRA